MTRRKNLQHSIREVEGSRIQRNPGERVFNQPGPPALLQSGLGPLFGGGDMFESDVDVAQEDLKRREFRKRGLDLVKRHGGREIDGENG